MNVVFRNIKWRYQKAIAKCYRRDPQLWVFGEWFGERCCDNSCFLANDIIRRDPSVRVVFICEPTADTSALDPNIQVVARSTPEAIELLKHAGVVIYSQSLSDFSGEMCLYALGAVTVNLWHGIPWKRIGLDAIPDTDRLKRSYTESVLKLQRPTLYLVTSEPYANVIRQAYCVNDRRLLRGGYPRNSIFYDADRVSAAREKILGLLQSQTCAPLDPQCKIITYMPTFRDQTAETFSFDSLAEDTRLQALLEKHNAIIVQKAHAVNDVKRREGDAHTGGRMFRLNKVIPMELLAATDLLITDYSGCFFDFLLTDRPIIHYLYDYDYYVNRDRGVYYAKEEVVCGDAVDTVSELLTAMDANLETPDRLAALRAQRREQFLTYESADACQKIYETLRSCLKR